MIPFSYIFPDINMGDNYYSKDESVKENDKKVLLRK